MNPEQNSKDSFPNNKAISDIILLLNQLIRSLIDKDELKANQYDQIILSKARFSHLVEQLSHETKQGWSKEYREMNSEELVQRLKQYMKEFGMILENNKEIYIMPLVGKILGQFPDDYKIEEDTNE